MSNRNYLRQHLTRSTDILFVSPGLSFATAAVTIQANELGDTSTGWAKSLCTEKAAS